MPYPSTFSSFSRPATTDKLNSPSHSALHNDTSSAVGQLEAVVGLNTGASASLVGTLMYDVRSPDSNGGGHVQTANKGGTGQTSYNKGDILVATSSSVLAKLVVSSVDGYVLTTAAAQATGVSWSPGGASTKLNVAYTGISKAGGLASVATVYYAASVTGSTLGTNNVVRLNLNFPTLNMSAFSSVHGSILYGNNVFANFSFPGPVSSALQGAMDLEVYIAANSSIAAQTGFVRGRVYHSNQFVSAGLPASPLATINPVFATGSSSVESSADQSVVVNIKMPVTLVSQECNVSAGLGVMEKIA